MAEKAEAIKAKVADKLDDATDKVHDKLSGAKSCAVQHDMFKKSAKKAFLACDYDNSGKLSGAELYTGILLVWDKVNKICPVHIKVPKQKEVKAIMKKHDVDSSGELTLAEFEDVVSDLAMGSTDSWRKSLWFRITASVVLKMAIFPGLGYGMKKGLDAAGFTPINKVPTAVLAFAAEHVYKVGTMAIADAED